MVGCLVQTCKVFDVKKVIELDEDVKELAYELAFTQGMAKGTVNILDYIYDNVEISDTINDELDKILENDLDKKMKKLTNNIQEILGIDNKFFICDINKNIINVFDISYDGFFNNEYKFEISEGLTKVVVSNK